MFSELIESNYRIACTGIQEDWLHKGWDEWYNHVLKLPISPRVTYLIVIFHNQVLNGGHHQYFLNGYGQFVKETILALKMINAKGKSKILEKAFSQVNSQNLEYKIFRKKLFQGEITDLFVNDNLFIPLDKLDNEYYGNDEDIESLLNEYLKSH